MNGVSATGLSRDHTYAVPLETHPEDLPVVAWLCRGYTRESYINGPTLVTAFVKMIKLYGTQILDS